VSTSGNVETVLAAGGAVELLMTGLQTMWADVAVDDSGVYWTSRDQGLVRTVPLGGGSATMLAQMQDLPWGITLDSKSIYWTEDSATGAVMRLAKP
jgi:hypothetical protein